MVVNTYLEGTYSELYGHHPGHQGHGRLVQAVLFPGGILRTWRWRPWPHRRGRRAGDSPVDAYGAALDNPDLIVACVIGDGEAETGPLAASWDRASSSTRPRMAGAADPAPERHKIAEPTVLARIRPRS